MESYASEIWSALGGLLAGAFGGSLLTLRITRNTTASGNGRVVNQSGSQVKGDQVGGNKSGK
jgi:hypothetical protein